MSKLTKQFIESEIQPPVTGQRFYRDEDIPGFAIRVTPKSCAYILEKRVNGANRRITIAKCSEISLETAKTQVCIMLGEIAKGNDPKSGKRINTLNDITLREVLQKFLETKPLRKDTQRNYHYAVNRHFNDWLDIPIASITKDMVEQRHHELTVSPNRLGTSGHGRANNALKKLSALINFAADRYGTEDEPLIKTNPVSRLSRNRSWHRIYPRQGIIPDHKLKDWYRAVGTLQHQVARDFMIFLLLTGMRFGETRKLKWSHVDFENRILIVPRELTKSDREHRLPLSDFLVELLRKRCLYRKNSEWVFQSSRLKDKHLSGGVGIVRRVRAKSGIHFTFHDLRRTFLTMGEKLDVPPYALKRLVNHSVSNDMTGRYLILGIERLRSHMSRITNAFLELLAINGSDMKEWKPAQVAVLTEVTQLRIPLNDVRIV
jgi:integrase